MPRRATWPTVGLHPSSARGARGRDAYEHRRKPAHKHRLRREQRSATGDRRRELQRAHKRGLRADSRRPGRRVRRRVDASTDTIYAVNVHNDGSGYVSISTGDTAGGRHLGAPLDFDRHRDGGRRPLPRGRRS